jgi:hypothetical protein
MNDVYKGLPQKDAICIHAETLVSFNCYPLALFPNKHFENSRCFARQIHCREHRRMQFDASSVRP